MKKAIALSLLSATCIAGARSESTWHKSFMQEMQRMEKAFDAMTERMNAFGKELDEVFTQDIAINLDVNLEEKEDTAIITVKNLKTDTLEADLNGDTDQLKIKTDQETITLSVQDKFLSFSCEKEAKKEDKKNDKTTAYTSLSAQQMGQLLSGRIDLAKTEINYDKKNQTITISMPYIDKKNTHKKIPVTINTK